MDKKEAAKKLIEMFGSVDAVGVAHSIVVEISKYVIILLFAVYTWHCFTVFLEKMQKKKKRFTEGRTELCMQSILSVP